MKINIIRGILIILLFGTFNLIFGFSNQNATESSSISRKVSEVIVNIFNKDASKESKAQMVENMQPIVRKLAHFSIYTVVGFLLMSLACTYNIQVKNKIIISLFIGFLYACSDEIHQLFIVGRSGEITDVLIDTSGVFLGIYISYGIWKIIKKGESTWNQKKRKEKD